MYRYSGGRSTSELSEAALSLCDSFNGFIRSSDALVNHKDISKHWMLSFRHHGEDAVPSVLANGLRPPVRSPEKRVMPTINPNKYKVVTPKYSSFYRWMLVIIAGLILILGIVLIIMFTALSMDDNNADSEGTSLLDKKHEY